ncbi:MAG: GMC family oxidoreductase [Hyphomicrobiaceae bacterium]
MAMQATRTFDYVIVGAGSAGCVLANRLSEEGEVSVALIEAGGRDTNIWIHIPSGYYKNINNPKITWQYGSGPEPHLGGRIVNWPRGRVLGGTSAINGLLYVRGQANDFNIWRQLGADGWSFEDVLPYFKKAERQERGESRLHGAAGPLGVSDVRMVNPICEAFIASALAEGVPRNDDFNGPNQEGVGYYQLTNWKGRRSSTAVAYLHPVKHRSNLTLITEATTERVLLDQKRATGVEITRNGQREIIGARREVLLAAGAIGSPQILQVSGVGPAHVLKAAGVDVRHDLTGVGENLQDHYQARLMYELNARGSLNSVWHSPIEQVRAGLEYALKRAGILTIGAGVVGIFAKSSPDLEDPDIQFHFIPLSSDGPGKGLHKFPGVIVSVCQLRPESRGTIHIKDRSVSVPPAIVSNYLEAETDQRVLLEAMKLARRIVGRSPFKDITVREFAPGPQAQSEDELMQFARDKGTTIFHPCGTCKMGVDTLAVVDPRLRVHGIAGLRVVDASVMPTMTSGNTNAPTIMIAEKAADMIKQDRKFAGAAQTDIGTAAL